MELLQSWAKPLIYVTVSNHFLNQCCHIANWTLKNKLQWNLICFMQIFLQAIAIENVICKMSDICSATGCSPWAPCTFCPGLSLLISFRQSAEQVWGGTRLKLLAGRGDQSSMGHPNTSPEYSQAWQLVLRAIKYLYLYSYGSMKIINSFYPWANTINSFYWRADIMSYIYNQTLIYTRCITILSKSICKEISWKISNIDQTMWKKVLEWIYFKTKSSRNFVI